MTAHNARSTHRRITHFLPLGDYVLRVAGGKLDPGDYATELPKTEPSI